MATDELARGKSTYSTVAITKVVVFKVLVYYILEY